MYTELNPFSSMGTPEGGLFLSQNDPSPIKSSSSSKPTLEFQDATQITQSEDQQQQEEERGGEILVSCPRIQTQSLGENKEDGGSGDSHEDGFRTPTSSDQRIPVIPDFPPAPRKPKSVPTSTKRKGACRRILVLDLSSEVESLFPPSLVVDLGGKMKKVRKTNAAK